MAGLGESMNLRLEYSLPWSGKMFRVGGKGFRGKEASQPIWLWSELHCIYDNLCLIAYFMSLCSMAKIGLDRLPLPAARISATFPTILPLR